MIKYSKAYVFYKVSIGGKKMNLLIVGSRSIQEYDLQKHIPKETTLILTGGADGIDLLAEKYADQNHLSKLILRPQYNRYGRGAPLKRNEQLVELCDMALIVWDGQSRGTKYTLNYAKKIGKPIILITV